jgi:hypothetical protein
MFFHIFPPDFRMTGMGYIVDFIKTPAQHGRLPVHMMGEDAEDLFIHGIFGDPEMIIKAGLGTPADVEGAVDMGLGPFHHLAEFVPVFYLFEVHQFHGSSGDDHTIVILILDLIKSIVESNQVLHRCILGMM